MRDWHQGMVTAIGYTDFVPTPGRVPFPDICCDLTWVRDEVYITGPESQPVATTFPGERVQLLRIDPIVARDWLTLPLGVIANRQVALRDIDRRLATQVRARFAKGRRSGTAPAATLGLPAWTARLVIGASLVAVT